MADKHSTIVQIDHYALARWEELGLAVVRLHAARLRRQGKPLPQHPAFKTLKGYWEERPPMPSRDTPRKPRAACAQSLSTRTP